MPGETIRPKWLFVKSLVLVLLDGLWICLAKNWRKVLGFTGFISFLFFIVWSVVASVRLNSQQNEACRITCAKQNRVVHNIDFERQVCVCGHTIQSVKAENWPE